MAEELLHGGAPGDGAGRDGLERGERMNRPRVPALDGALGFWRYGGPRSPEDPGTGGWRYLSCGTSDEQSGAVLGEEARMIPPRKWMTVHMMGFWQVIR